MSNQLKQWLESEQAMLDQAANGTCNLPSDSRVVTYSFLDQLRTSHEQAIAALEIAVEALETIHETGGSCSDYDTQTAFARIEALWGNKESGE